ncbi:MAG: hypothetical protein GY943_21710 [Chloroflexi bacterium]|nr:hypothetical protein [Chloroflexota bacterium]
MPIGIFCAYFFVAIMMTWPLATHITTHLPGGSTDTLIHYWNGWQVQQALINGRSPFFTTHIFYPQGVSLVTHNLPWMNIMPWLLLEPLFQGIVAYNIVFLFNLALCGLSAYLLVHYLTKNHYAAFISGLIYLAWPYRLSQLDHPNLISTYWIPIVFLTLTQLMRATEPKIQWRKSLMLGLAFALVGYTRWQHLIPLTLMTLLYFGLTLPSWWRTNGRFILAQLSIAGLIAILLLAPPAYLLSTQFRNEEPAEVDLILEGEEAIMQTDLLAYITPSRNHPLFGQWTQPLYDRYYANRFEARRYAAYIGITVLVLAISGLLHLRWRGAPWLLMGLMLMSLSFGTLFRVNGRFFDNMPTLYRTLAPLEFIRLIRVPDRFNLYIALPIAVLAGYGIMSWLQRRQWTQPRKVAALIGLFILFEYALAPVPMWQTNNRPSYYEEMAQHPGAVLNLPFNIIKTKRYMFDQTIHQRPILQGKVTRLPANVYDFYNSFSLLAEGQKFNEPPIAITDVGQQFALLAKNNVNDIIVHKDQMEGGQAQRWQWYFATTPRYEDDKVAIYTTSPQHGQDFELQTELMPNLGPITYRFSASCLSPGELWELDLVWASLVQQMKDFDLQLALLNSQGDIEQIWERPLTTSHWQPGSLVHDFYPVNVDVEVGVYSVQILLSDGNQQGKSFVLPQQVIVQPQPCPKPTLPANAERVNGRFGDTIQLHAFDSQQTASHLSLTLYWQTSQRISTDYKLFTHVFDPATGIPVAQHDAMPRNWTFPTTLWWPGDTVIDTFTIPLSGIPNGQYGIAVGIYNSVTGERLPLIDEIGQEVGDGRFHLNAMATIPFKE